MKSIKTTLAALLFIAAILPWISCKKESTASNNPSQDKIIGKWRLQSTVANDFYAGTPHITTYTGTAADNADFRTDGKVYAFINGNYDTSAYAKISNTKMWIGNTSDTFDIQTLTDTDFKLYRKETYNAGEYYETTITLKK
jgi:hypothetical protein